jgi:hypothetical protein
VQHQRQWHMALRKYPRTHIQEIGHKRPTKAPVLYIQACNPLWCCALRGTRYRGTARRAALRFGLFLLSWFCHPPIGLVCGLV